MVKKFAERFRILESELEEVARTRHRTHTEMFGEFEHVDSEAFAEWKVKAKNLLSAACGKDSEHYVAFVKNEKSQGFSGSWSIYCGLRPIFRAAREDYEGGYIISVKALVQAEVFDAELDQASELLRAGYPLPAAVVAGVVLETSMRDLCDRTSIDIGKLDKMNADLAKAGVYNKLQQKRITAIAGIRNSAAHGNTDEFEPEDVQSMISDIERFLASHFDG